MTEQLTLFSEDTLASLSRQPGSERERRMTATSGRRCLELSRKSGPVGSLEKTLLGTSRWASTLYLLTWKVKVTPAGRSYFQLQASAPRTKEKGSSSWATPVRSDYKRRDPNSKQKTGESMITLTDQARHSEGRKAWPTPMASDGTTGGIIGKDDKFVMTSNGYPRKVTRHGTNGSIGLARLAMLEDQFVKAWPTPSTREWKGGRKPETLKAKGRGVTNTLNDAINFNEGTVGQLNPDWVEHLMGFPESWTNTDGPPLSGNHNTIGKPQD